MGPGYSIHLGLTKMYHDLRRVHWWEGLKTDIEDFVAKCPNFSRPEFWNPKPASLPLRGRRQISSSINLIHMVNFSGKFKTFKRMKYK